MSNRWRVLALLFSIRTVMAFQFGTVGSLGPLIGQSYQVDMAGVGILIGLYLSPGLIFAMPGSAIGKFFGDKRAVLLGLALMTLGGAISSVAATWDQQLVGRTIAGLGGVILNVLMSKMVADWFHDHEIATAMAIFVNSWLAGIALALLVQPLIAAEVGLAGAFSLTTILAVSAFAALLFFYDKPVVMRDAHGVLPSGADLVCITIAGAIWGLFNAALAVVFGFGPILLNGRGWELAAASSVTSITVFCGALTVPLSGLLADRTGRPSLVIVLGLTLTALAMVALPRSDYVVATLVLIGLLGGVPAGAILGLPVRVLSPPTRVLGMGLFYTLLYGFIVVAPPIAGYLIAKTGWDGAAMDLAAAMLLASVALLAAFEHYATTIRDETAALISTSRA